MNKRKKGKKKEKKGKKTMGIKKITFRGNAEGREEGHRGGRGSKITAPSGHCPGKLQGGVWLPWSDGDRGTDQPEFTPSLLSAG